MKTQVFLTILLVSSVALSAPVPTRLLSNTNFYTVESCLTDIEGAYADFMTSIKDARSKNWPDFVKYLLRSGAEGIDSYNNCEKMTQADWFAWIDQHDTTHLKTALNKGAAAVFDLIKGIMDLVAKKPMDNLLQDYEKFCEDAEDFWKYIFPKNAELLEAFKNIK